MTITGTSEKEDDGVVTQSSLQRFLYNNLPTRLEMLQRMNGIGNPLKDEDILFSNRLANLDTGLAVGELANEAGRKWYVQPE